MEGDYDMAQFKQYMQRSWKNIKQDLKEEVKQQFDVEFEGHHVTVHTTVAGATLFIDGELVDEVNRPSKLGKLRPSEVVKGEKNGLHVKAKVNGIKTLDCTFYINGKKFIKQKHELNFSMWKHREKIVPALIEAYEKNGTLENFTLPDEGYYYFDEEEHLEPGAYYEVLFSEHEQGYEHGFAKKLLKKVDWLLEKPSDKTRNSIYEDVLDDDFPEYALLFNDMLAELEVDEAALHKEAMWFIEHAAHRYVVDFALLLLGRSTVACDVDLLRVIGRHEEFTAFVAVALHRHGAPAHELLFELAKDTTGYGQQAAILMLEPTTESIRTWLLYDAPLLTESSLALIVAIAQKSALSEALKADSAPRELFARATMMLMCLTESEETVELYNELPEALLDYVRHAKTHITTYEQLYPIAKMAEYLSAYEWDYLIEYTSWQPVESNLVLSGLDAILTSANWQPMIEKAFAEERTMAQAITIARASGAEYMSLVYKKIVNGHFEPYLYAALIAGEDTHLFRAVIDYVEQFELAPLNPLERECIELLIDELSSYDGVGKRLMHHALQLEDELLTFSVLDTLQLWKVSSYLPEFEQELQNIAKTSANRAQRRFAKCLAKGH